MSIEEKHKDVTNIHVFWILWDSLQLTQLKRKWSLKGIRPKEKLKFMGIVTMVLLEINVIGFTPEKSYDYGVWMELELLVIALRLLICATWQNYFNETCGKVSFGEKNRKYSWQIVTMILLKKCFLLLNFSQIELPIIFMNEKNFLRVEPK